MRWCKAKPAENRTENKWVNSTKAKQILFQISYSFPSLNHHNCIESNFVVNLALILISEIFLLCFPFLPFNSKINAQDNFNPKQKKKTSYILGLGNFRKEQGLDSVKVGYYFNSTHNCSQKNREGFCNVTQSRCREQNISYLPSPSLTNTDCNLPVPYNCFIIAKLWKLWEWKWAFYFIMLVPNPPHTLSIIVSVMCAFTDSLRLWWMPGGCSSVCHINELISPMH